MSGVLLRDATAADADAIVTLIRSSKAAAMPWLAVPHSVEEDLPWVVEVLLQEATVIVVDVEGAIVGVMAVEGAWLSQLYVAAEQQGVGTGGLLLDRAKDLSPGGLRLWAFQRNTRARRFYEGAGFVATRFTSGTGNEEHEPDVLYSWLP